MRQKLQTDPGCQAPAPTWRRLRSVTVRPTRAGPGARGQLGLGVVGAAAGFERPPLGEGEGEGSGGGLGFVESQSSPPSPQRRKKQKLAKERAGLSKLPDLKDAEAVQKFFLEEIQLGEELLAQGEYDKGVDHLTNAIAVCGQPQQLLQVLQQTLPTPVFQMLLTKLPTISQRIVSVQSLAEDDVE